MEACSANDYAMLSALSGSAFNCVITNNTDARKELAFNLDKAAENLFNRSNKVGSGIHK